jgi:Zn-dependent protease
MTVFVVVVAGWLASVCLHEFGHALTAYMGGDAGVRRRGYLTNPLKYIHPVNSIIMPMIYLAVGGLGLPGAAVMIDERSLRSRFWRVMVSLAGPVMSALAGLVLAAPFILGRWSPTDPRPVVVAFGMLVQLQVMAVFFNLLPVPPLDGFQAVASLLFSYRTKRRLMRSSNWVFFILILVMFRSQGARRFVWESVFSVTQPLGLTPETFADAFRQFQFWRG